MGSCEYAPILLGEIFFFLGEIFISAGYITLLVNIRLAKITKNPAA
jgi:hypothetical protein